VTITEVISETIVLTETPYASPTDVVSPITASFNSTMNTTSTITITPLSTITLTNTLAGNTSTAVITLTTPILTTPIVYTTTPCTDEESRTGSASPSSTDASPITATIPIPGSSGFVTTYTPVFNQTTSSSAVVSPLTTDSSSIIYDTFTFTISSTPVSPSGHAAPTGTNTPWAVPTGGYRGAGAYGFPEGWNEDKAGKGGRWGKWWGRV